MLDHAGGLQNNILIQVQWPFKHFTQMITYKHSKAHTDEDV